METIRRLLSKDHWRRYWIGLPPYSESDDNVYPQDWVVFIVFVIVAFCLIWL